jgi:hypothetical protein
MRWGKELHFGRNQCCKAEEIQEVINVKAGITEANVTEFFEYQGDEENEEEGEEIDGGENPRQLPSKVTASASASGHRSSNISIMSSSNQSTTAATNQSTTAATFVNKKKTRGNMMTSAIQQATEQTKSSFK